MKKLKLFLQNLSSRVLRIINFILFFAGLLLIGCGVYYDATYMFILGVFLWALAVICITIAYRCPYCDAAYNVKSGIPNYCPHCGKELKR